mgnify:CR=1 FL=1
MVPLSFAQPNKDFYISEIKGNTRSKCCLLEKGLCIGNKVRVMGDCDNCFIVKINDTIKYVLSFAIANKIMLRED